ncbi:hypothetical protein [Rhizobium jaguaris]|nr:hypothetical protein [Rhizobium jaguaris]
MPDKFDWHHRSRKRFAAALVMATLSVPHMVKAAEVTDWQSEWSAGQVAEPVPYCKFSWDSGTGRAVEFDYGPDKVAWIVTDAGWKLPKADGVKVSIVGRKATWHVTARALDQTSVLLSSAPEDAQTTKDILRHAMAGMADVELRFPASSRSWLVPLSRIYPMHSTFADCLAHLSVSPPAGSDSNAGSPF